MDVRKHAVDLTGEERDKFLMALVLLNNTQADGAPEGVTRYDQFIALHSVIMAVFAPGETEPLNYGHGNIGFFPWHRQFVREFEKALQEMVEGVTVPYWDWADPTAFSKVFTGDFLGSLIRWPARPLPNSILRNPVPEAERPAWWPAGVDGYPIHPDLGSETLVGAALLRGTTQGALDVWRPRPDLYDEIVDIDLERENVHPFWQVWRMLEAGHRLVRTQTGWVSVNERLPTHNAGHNFFGGHMSNPRVSPNDPVFWFHHANVDRLWANWQTRRLRDFPGTTPEFHYPPPDQPSPLGHPQRPGQRLSDVMWPWVGGAPGYRLGLPADDPLPLLLREYTGQPVVHVKDVLDTETMDKVGYRYAPPGG